MPLNVGVNIPAPWDRKRERQEQERQMRTQKSQRSFTLLRQLIQQQPQMWDPKSLQTAMKEINDTGEFTIPGNKLPQDMGGASTMDRFINPDAMGKEVYIAGPDGVKSTGQRIPKNAYVYRLPAEKEPELLPAELTNQYYKRAGFTNEQIATLPAQMTPKSAQRYKALFETRDKPRDRKIEQLRSIVKLGKFKDADGETQDIEDIGQVRLLASSTFGLDLDEIPSLKKLAESKYKEPEEKDYFGWLKSIAAPLASKATDLIKGSFNKAQAAPEKEPGADLQEKAKQWLKERGQSLDPKNVKAVIEHFGWQ